MRSIFVFIFALALCLTAKAGEIVSPKFQTQQIIYTNALFSSNINGTVTFTNSYTTEKNLYHTVQFFSSAWTNTLDIGTNFVAVSIDSTIDGSNWYNEYTQNLINSGTNACEKTLVGKWEQIRCRITMSGTNLTVKAFAMGEGQ